MIWEWYPMPLGSWHLIISFFQKALSCPKICHSKTKNSLFFSQLTHKINYLSWSDLLRNALCSFFFIPHLNPPTFLWMTPGILYLFFSSRREVQWWKIYVFFCSSIFP